MDKYGINSKNLTLDKKMGFNMENVDSGIAMSKIRQARNDKSGTPIRGDYGLPSGCIDSVSQFTILLVDDSFVSLRGMARMLKKTWETDVASDAEEAIYMIRRNRYTVVISDCDMPGKDGIWLLEQTSEVSPNTIRILASGGESERFVPHLKSGLVHCFLTKPISPDRLNELLAQLIV